MANDRMFLRCPRCGEKFQLAKRMGEAWYVGNNVNPGSPMEVQLNKFFSDHFGCALNGDAWAFELHTEQGPMAVISPH